MKLSYLSLAMLLSFVGLSANAAQAQPVVWIETSTLRICRSETPPPSPSREVNLTAARNEWVSFQVFLRSSHPLPAVGVELSPLEGQSGGNIDSACFRIYREHQLELKEPTYRNDAFRADWYPDPLIPARHPLTGEPLSGPRFTAQPFDLPANETHGFWVDVFVSKDVPPGTYRGTLKVISQEGQVVAMPVNLEVWDFTLPRVPSLVTALGSPAERMRAYYARQSKEGKESEQVNWATVEKQCALLAQEHRINAYPPSDWLRLEREGEEFRLSDENVARLREWIDTYCVNAIQVPSPVGIVKDPQANNQALQAWARAWDRAIESIDRPHVVYYIYLKDEPNDPEAYEFVRVWGKAIRATKTKVKVMVVEQTRTQNPAWGDLYGAVDIWCSLFPLYDEPTARERQALGEIMWAYTALCQLAKTPWWHIDYPLLNYRVPCWMSYRYDIRGLLYWGGMSHWSQVEDPWTDPRTYRPGRSNRPLIYNGEGTLVYPAKPCGYDGIVPSLRLKALRDGIEDYDYFMILQRAGQGEKALKIVQQLAPSWFEWNPDPQAYEAARRELAKAILSLPNEVRNPTW
ncbi:MAG TPA: DUF4091 domain-containing protein [Thermogutta sp.]|nr:DUF4091 domain-containing protein [Thermogutta sp.]HQF13706.1 DUF4091 domain-containing protein [Thermogutta sp.]